MLKGSFLRTPIHASPILKHEQSQNPDCAQVGGRTPAQVHKKQEAVERDNRLNYKAQNEIFRA